VKYLEIRPGDELFTHRDPDSGVYRHFNSSAIARAITSGKLVAQKVKADLPKSLADHLRANGGIEPVGLERAARRVDVPILIADFKDGQSMIIDGNHRALYRFDAGYTFVMAYVLSEDQWTPYLVTDFPSDLEDLVLKAAGFP
jgi:hypothetical protein